jgi:hypothetical protein
MGAAVAQESVMFRDRMLHHDFRGASWFELYLFGITGRVFNSQQLQILNAMWIFTSYPDPRIWNNRVAALAGTVRSTGSLAVGAAIAVSEAEIYGAKPIIQAVGALKKALEWVDNGNQLAEFLTAELKSRRKIAGFGRPKAMGDERIQPLLEYLDQVGFQHGRHVGLAFEIEKFLRDGRWRFRLNYAGLVAAVCADMGLSAREAYLYSISGFLAGFLPCYIDAIEHPIGSFFPMRCARIHYEGPRPRSWTDIS